MRTYEVTFNTDAERACWEVTAKTPEEALSAAQEMVQGRTDELYFASHTSAHAAEEIIIEQKDNEVCRWQSDDLRLRLAARDLLTAACAVIDR
jgi:hypothetical protein